MDNALAVTVLAGERDTVRGAERDSEANGDRDSDAAADRENDIFGEVDAGKDADDVLLEFDDAELEIDCAAERLGVSKVLGDCEWLGDFESDENDEGDAESRGTAVNVGVTSVLRVTVSREDEDGLSLGNSDGDSAAD